MAQGTITCTDDLRVGHRYRLYRNGRQLDNVKLHIIDESRDIGYIARGRHDQMEQVDLTTWLDEYAVLPDNGVPVEHELLTTRSAYPPRTVNST